MRKPLFHLAAVLALAAGVLSIPVAAQGEPVRVAEFVADCQLSHRLQDDPIVLPRVSPEPTP